ncbi:MAG: hypothetical protein OXL97_15470 [Chloroflexota bacterium]|nr:hypothetical protein [Chloroflexota bacterium]MDE2884167.1 hypothetical protein [Chloroflexota bacterium]
MEMAFGAIGVMLAAYSIYYAHRQASQAKTAAQRAQRAAEWARGQLGQNSAIADMTLASGRIDHLKELHVSQQWQRALDHYTPLRQALQSARRNHPSPSDRVQRDFEEAVSWALQMENEVGTAAARGEPPSAPRLNGTLNQIQVRLDQARIDLAHEYQVRGGPDGPG